MSTDKALGKGVIWSDNHIELVWVQFRVELNVVAGGVRTSGAKAGLPIHLPVVQLRTIMEGNLNHGLYNGKELTSGRNYGGHFEMFVCETSLGGCALRNGREEDVAPRPGGGGYRGLTQNQACRATGALSSDPDVLFRSWMGLLSPVENGCRMNERRPCPAAPHGKASQPASAAADSSIAEKYCCALQLVARGNTSPQVR